jgi:hypothetical protein
MHFSWVNKINKILKLYLNIRELNLCRFISYRGTFSNSRDGMSDVKFRKISRILGKHILYILRIDFQIKSIEYF